MLTNNKTTTITLELDNACTYIELPKVMANVKFIKINQLMYRCISPAQSLLMMKMSNQSGLSFNHNVYFTSDHFTNVLKCFYLGPENSTTLYESQSSDQWTVMLGRPETISTLTIDWLIDGELTSDISPTNKIVLTFDFIGA